MMAGTIIVSMVVVSCCSYHSDGKGYHSCYGDVADICNSYLPPSVNLSVHLPRLKLGRFLNHQ